MAGLAGMAGMVGIVGMASFDSEAFLQKLGICSPLLKIRPSLIDKI